MAFNRLEEKMKTKTETAVRRGLFRAAAKPVPTSEETISSKSDSEDSSDDGEMQLVIHDELKKKIERSVEFEKKAGNLDNGRDPDVGERDGRGMCSAADAARLIDAIKMDPTVNMQLCEIPAQTSERRTEDDVRPHRPCEEKKVMEKQDEGYVADREDADDDDEGGETKNGQPCQTLVTGGEQSAAGAAPETKMNDMSRGELM